MTRRLLQYSWNRVGKTSLLARYSLDTFPAQTQMRIGLEFYYKRSMVGDWKIKQIVCGKFVLKCTDTVALGSLETNTSNNTAVICTLCWRSCVMCRLDEHLIPGKCHGMV